MPPQNVAEMLDNSNLDATWEKFVKYLTRFKFLAVGKIENLSLPQLKTIYNLNFKHNEELNDGACIVDFAELQHFAVQKKKLIISDEELVFPTHNLKAINSIRPTLQKQMDDLALQERILKDKLHKNRNVKVDLNAKKLEFITTLFGVGYDKRFVDKIFEDFNPAIFCGLNTNFEGSVRTSDLEFKGYATFIRNVAEGLGGLVIHINKNLEPSLSLELDSNRYESLWIELTHPDFIRISDKLEKPKLVLGVVREDRNNSQVFYEELLSNLANQTNFLLIIEFLSNKVEEFQQQVKNICAHQKIPLSSKLSHGYLVCHKGAIFAGINPQLNSSNFAMMSLALPRLSCNCCKEAFITKEDFDKHKSSLRHRRNYYSHFLNTCRSMLVRDKNNVTLEIVERTNFIEEEESTGIIRLQARPSIPNVLKLKICNNTPEEEQQFSHNSDGTKQKLGVIISSITTLTNDPGFILKDEHGVTNPKEKRGEKVKGGIRMANGKSYIFELKCVKPDIGQYRMPFFVHYKVETLGGEINGVVVREVVLKVFNQDVKLIQCVAPFQPPKPIFKKLNFGNSVISGLPIERESKAPKIKTKWNLDHYSIKEGLRKVLKNERYQINVDKQADDALKNYKLILERPLDHEGYFKRFSLLMHCEEFQMELDIRHYDMEKTTMTEKGPKFLRLEVPGLSENRPSVLPGDRIYAQVFSNPNQEHPEQHEYEGNVHEVEESAILVGFNAKLRRRFINNMRFNIRFTFNRFPLRNMHRASEYIAHNPEYSSYVFPTASTEELRSSATSAAGINFFDPNIAQNTEQSLAVANIVKGGVPGVPYIIFGPPGTGKTVTITEAIKQIWKNQNSANIIAAAPSNSAADLLATKLLKVVPKTQIIRFYARSRLARQVPEEMKPISRFHPSHEDDSLEALKQYRIIVVTLVSAGKLASLGFPSDHFSHLFIDEAGHATEPEAIVPLSGVLRKGGQFVLAGDPKQLGPVLRSPIALKHGLQISLLERLMNTSDIYKRDSIGNFHTKAITKLLDNYRSHPTLLSLPSLLFYDNELKARGDKFLTHDMLNWSKLPNKKIPLIFHGIVGEDQRESRSPSYFNPEEAAMVVQYVQDLLEEKEKGIRKVLPKEIGVISPYRQQVRKIKELMNKKFQNKSQFKDWTGITVGSTEEFQGQERRIIIISTVRSKPTLIGEDYNHKLGFLNNPKRFNVAITRAKALMVVIGNPHLLSMDKWWKEFLKYSLNNSCYKGVPFCIPREIGDVDGFVDVNQEEIAKYELDSITERFKEMDIHMESSDSEEDDNVIDFAEIEGLNDISLQEYQQNIAWRHEM